MRGSPEALVAHLRNRKGRIVSLSILIPILLGLIACQWFFVTSSSERLVPKEGEDLVLHAVLSESIILLTSFMATVALVLALLLTKATVALIIEFTAFTKNDLLVDLWDRVQALERPQTTGANTDQPQPPPLADQLGG